MLLAACGGGSSGGGPSTSAPPPPQTNSTLTNLTVSQTFSTASATIKGHLTSLTGIPSGVNSQQSDLGSAVTVSYDAQRDRYSISVREAGVTGNETFGAAEHDLDESNADVDVYSRETGDESQLFLLFKPGNPAKGLTYVAYGAWQKLNSASGVDFATTYFIFGVRTETADMPTTGTASYSAIVEGVWTDSLAFHTLAGTADLTADFGGGTVDGRFDLIGHGVSGNVRPFDILTGSASISGNTFSGTLAGETRSFSGDWGGGFFGPGAQEIGGTFNVTNGNEHATGAFVGN